MAKTRKPLKQTKTVDYWKCPWCREKHSHDEVLGGQQELDSDHLITCPTCGNEVLLMPSIEFTCVPTRDGEPIE